MSQQQRWEQQQWWEQQVWQQQLAWQQQVWQPQGWQQEQFMWQQNQGWQQPKGKGRSQKGRPQQRKQQTPKLRFDLNDRVVCNIGVRWAAGNIVGVDPHCKDEWVYLVKLDSHPGLEGRTICVPEDTEYVCFQEVCFGEQLPELTKGAAPELPKKAGKMPLRFAQGDRVVCRVRHGPDKLENWRAGEVDAEYPPLPEPLEWGDEDDDAEGSFPASVAYRVKLDGGGVVICHADNYTLIRREGLEPQTRVRGVSKRLEDRKNSDGVLIRFDHVTERHKQLECTSSKTDAVVVQPAEEQKAKETKAEVPKKAIELTAEQRKALFLE